MRACALIFYITAAVETEFCCAKKIRTCKRNVKMLRVPDGERK